MMKTNFTPITLQRRTLGAVFASLLGGLLALPLLCVAADKPANLQPLPDVPPPPRMTSPNATPEDAPTITIREEKGTRYEEYRKQGKIYQIKVTPPTGVPYYLIDEEGKGQYVRANQPVTRPPMWLILQF